MVAGVLAGAGTVLTTVAGVTVATDMVMEVGIIGTETATTITITEEEATTRTEHEAIMQTEILPEEVMLQDLSIMDEAEKTTTPEEEVQAQRTQQEM